LHTFFNKATTHIITKISKGLSDFIIEDWPNWTMQYSTTQWPCIVITKQLLVKLHVSYITCMFNQYFKQLTQIMNVDKSIVLHVFCWHFNIWYIDIYQRQVTCIFMNIQIFTNRVQMCHFRWRSASSVTARTATVPIVTTEWSL